VKESARRSMNTIPNPDPNPRSPEPSSADVAEAGGVGSSTEKPVCGGGETDLVAFCIM
jgi:hypothetical protein